jgi:uncharacterized phage protein gp47/JayE
MANIQLRSYQNILGQMISTLLAQTDLNDLSPGSVFLTLLEAAASSDFTQEGKLLTLINLRDIDKAKGVDLENLASELGVTPARLGAKSASVQISIRDTAFSKISSNVFAGDVAPAAGDSALKINNATSFNASGTIYIGRGSSTSESVAYVSKVNNGTFWTLNLASNLTKDHFVGEEVVLAQGGDRDVLAGTIAQVPSAAGSPAIQFSTQIDVVLPDGEDTIQAVSATAVLPGSSGNVGINKITEFPSPPFSTATVINDQFPAAGGSDTETDAELRQRIKDHVHNIGKGTERAIISTVIGVSDPDQGNRVVSAFLREPTEAGQLGILFIDDGTGFQPSFSGIGEESIVTKAVGTEKFVQLQNFPIVKSQIASVGTEPFNLKGGERLRFVVDGLAEEQPLSNTQYRTPGIVSAQEVVQTINAVFTTIEARAKNGQIFVVPVSDDPDFIQVTSASSDDANAAILFPLHKQYTIRLYKNSVLLQKNGATATIQSFPNTEWPPFNNSESLQLQIDGILSPLVTLTDSDFATLTSSLTIAGASPSDWATVINARFIGITATAQTDGTFTLTSNRGKITSASISVISGTLAGRIINASASSTGITSQFKLNRLLGQIELAAPLEQGSALTAGNTLTQGFVNTSSQPIFDLSATLGSPAKFVMVTDAPGSILAVNQIVSLLTFSIPSSGIQRISGAVGQFSNVLVDDWGYFYNLPINGFVKVYQVANDGSYVDCFFADPVSGTDTPDGFTKQFSFFRTTGLPQEVTLPVGAAISGSSIVSVINSQISGGIAELMDNDIVQIRTQRLDSSGGLLIPILAGTAINLGFMAGDLPNNDPQSATEESGDLAGYPNGRLTIQTPDLVAPYDTLSVNGTPFNSYIYNNRPVLAYLGESSKLIREPEQLVSSSSLTLRENTPLQTDPIGGLQKLTTTSGLEFGQKDNFVVIMDDNPNEKTFDIPMYIDATIASPAVPSTTQFDATDSTGALLGSSTRWLGHRFEDYRVWFKAKADLPFNVANTEMRITSVKFGPQGEKIQFGIFYPATASSPAAATYSIDSLNSLVLVSLVLSSGSARVIGLTPNANVSVSSTGPVGNTYTWTIQFIPPVSLATVQIGDIVALNDGSFSTANQVQMAVQSITNLSDATRSYEFIEEIFPGSSISGGTNFSLGGSPAQTLSAGDKLTINSITLNATAVGANQITVPTGGAYAVGGGTVTVFGTPYTYTGYNAGTGVFSGVTPDPNGIVVPGNPIKQTVTPDTHFVQTVATASTGTSDAPFTSNGIGYDITLTHAAITADASPSFSVSAGDKIQVASQLLTVQSVISSTIYTVDSPFSFSGSQNGTISRIILMGTKTTTAITESISSSSSAGVVVMQLNNSGNTASSLISAVNNTAGVQEIVSAANGVGSTGAGIVTTSTEDLLANGDTRSSLENSESFVLTTASSSPAITLKVPAAMAPEIGESIRLVPMTPANVRDHFNRKQISGLSNAAEVDLVNGARHIQISSLIPGGIGQVFAVGGTGSGNNVLPLRDSSQQISNSIGAIKLDHSALDLLNPGNLIFISQTGRAKKSYVGASPDPSTTAQIQTVSPTTARITFGVPLAATKSYTHTGSVVWAVRRLSKNRLRFEVFSGTASLPGTLQADDWVLVGDGTSYAGITPAQFFASANRGYFQIRETDASTYFDVDAVGIEQFVTCTSSPFVFLPYHSARIGDQLVIANSSPFSQVNQGTFLITAVNDAFNVEYANSASINEGPSALGTNGTGSISVLDQGYSTYRSVDVLAPDPSDPTNQAIVIVTPGYNISLLNQAQGAVTTLPNRLGFGSDPVPGISGYQFWTGLKRRVQRTLDGYAPDPVSFQGVRAAGVGIEAREPQIQRVTMTIKVTTNQGVALSSISDTIKSSVIGFINSLGLGQNVVLSEVVSIIQSISGVKSVVLANPVLEQEIITVNDNAIARTSASEITLS